MECSCFDADVDEYGTVLEDKVVTARKAHRCHECGKSISLGENYRREKAVYDGQCDTHKTCLDCSSIRNELVCSFYWGEVLDLVRESIFECGGTVSESAISRLTPGARSRICEIIEDLWTDDDEMPDCWNKPGSGHYAECDYCEVRGTCGIGPQ